MLSRVLVKSTESQQMQAISWDNYYGLIIQLNSNENL